ncbi:hypothetical protein ACQYAD_04750 [Neobacillus sp. SM06]|uniref:hypothetical protein n=1 Tax=Neobacillus sp. SM06 TaxID=3422492 RepID=UPI003D286C98
MVNENFELFRKEQKKHKPAYLGSDQNQPPGVNDADYNHQDNTDQSVGAIGRKVE